MRAPDSSSSDGPRLLAHFDGVSGLATRSDGTTFDPFDRADNRAAVDSPVAAFNRLGPSQPYGDMTPAVPSLLFQAFLDDATANEATLPGPAGVHTSGAGVHTSGAGVHTSGPPTTTAARVPQWAGALPAAPRAHPGRALLCPGAPTPRLTIVLIPNPIPTRSSNNNPRPNPNQNNNPIPNPNQARRPYGSALSLRAARGHR